MRRSSWACARAAAVLLLSVCELGEGEAHAQANAGLMPVSPSATSRDDPTLAPVFPERRNGVVFGAASGIAFAGASGYPNSAKFFGNSDYFSSSPLLVGWSGSFFLLGALSDYISFGPMFTLATFESDKWKSTGWGFGVRGEVYPFVGLASKSGSIAMLADTSVFTQLGVGSTELRAKGPYPDADGTQSFLGLGLHQEWRLGRLLGGHGAAGPYAEYDLIHAPSIQRHSVTFGIRVVWYGGGVKLDQPR
jgi:hypothetical protein